MKKQDLQRLTVGAKVSTELGEGVVVSIQQQFNGLQIIEGTEEIVVWFPIESRKKWVSFKFHFSQIELI